MPGNMRLHTRPSNEFHTDDTPPSTRPSSAASTSSTPNRSTSMDSLHTNSSSDKPTGEEFIPTRLIRAAPKLNSNAMQFVKTGPANLHKSAKEQMKKAEVVKSLRKTSLQEEEDWQSSSPSANPATLEESTDWQTNLDKWKSSRRKRNEDVLERVIEVKKYEKEEEYTRGRRKSKTFSEMREDKDKRGRKYNLVVHDTDNNDLSDLGLNSRKNDGSSSLSDAAEDAEHKDLDNDNKDTKSDAGFCTGSDTGSDGVFAEDNISDTSSALGDKKDAHDSLLDSGLPMHSKESLLMSEHISLTSTKSMSSSLLHTNEYTYDKAIEEYKMFAENSVKKRTPSLTSLSSNASFSKEDEKTSFRSQDISRKLDDKPSYFHRERDRDIKPVVHEPRFMRRDRNLKVDINKRRSMFELRDIDSENNEQKQINRRSIDVSDKLKTKVMSFESVSESDKKTRLVTPTRDSKFKEKLANFSHRNNVTSSSSSVTLRKKTPERDQNFYKKLQSFTRLESEEANKSFNKSTTKSPPIKTASTRVVFEKKLPISKPSERKVSLETRAKTSSLRSGMPLKDRIASFENLSPAEHSIREKSVSMECLNKNSFTEDFRPLNSSVSVSNLSRRTPSTPYMVIELDEPLEAEEMCTKSKVSRDYLNSSTLERREQTIKRTFGSTDNVEDTIAPTGPPPKVPVSNSSSKVSSSLRRASASPTRKSPSPSRTPSSPTKKTFVSTRSRSPSPSINKMSVSPSRDSLLPDLNVKSSISSSLLSKTPQKDATSADTFTSSVKRVSTSPTRVSSSSSSDNLSKESPPEVPKCPPPQVPMCPPPLYSNGYSEDHRPTFEIQSMEMIDDFSHTENTVDDSSLKEYGDDDIDEVIDTYEHLSKSVTGTELPQEHYYESTLDTMGSLPKDQYEENMYERIHDDEPMYENIYEKVIEFSEDASMETSDYLLDHQYQTLEEVKTEVESFTSPPLPPKNAVSTNVEVLDVTWTDESTSPVLPPSVPPPPPPPDKDDFEDGTDSEGSVPPHLIPSLESLLEKEERLTKPKTSAKQELRQKMSDFLGTQPQVHEEITLKPPPDVNEILRHERVEERLIVQKQQNLSRDRQLLDYDPLMPQPYRPRYTWEDRMKADSAKPHDMDESCDHLDFQMSKTRNDDVHALNTYRKYVKVHSLSHSESRNAININTEKFSEEASDQKLHPFICSSNSKDDSNFTDDPSVVDKLNLKSLIKTSEDDNTYSVTPSFTPFFTPSPFTPSSFTPSFSLPHLDDQNTASIFTANNGTNFELDSVVCLDSSSSLEISEERNPMFAPDRTISIHYQDESDCPMFSALNQNTNECNVANDLNMNATSASRFSGESKFPPKSERRYNPTAESYYPTAESYYPTAERYYPTSNHYYPSKYICEKNNLRDYFVEDSNNVKDCVCDLGLASVHSLQSKNSSISPSTSVSYVRHTLSTRVSEPSLKVKADSALQNKASLSVPSSSESLSFQKNEGSNSNSPIISKEKAKNLSSSQVASVDVLPDVKIYKVSKNLKSSLQNVGEETYVPSEGTDKSGHPSRLITIIFPPNTNASSNSSYVIANTPANFHRSPLGLNNQKILSNSSEENKIIKPHYLTSDLPIQYINPSKASNTKCSDQNYLECCDFGGRPVVPKQRTVKLGKENNVVSKWKGTDSNSYVDYPHVRKFPYVYNKKLEELEQEMVKHDREMLQRIKPNDPLEERTNESVGRDHTFPDSGINFDPPSEVDLSQSEHFNQILEIERSFNSKSSSKVSVEQNYANSTSSIPPPSQYGEYTSIPAPQQVYSDRYYEDANNSVVVPQPPPRQSYATTQNGPPANLPIQEFYTAPVYNDQHSCIPNNLDYQENSSFEDDSKSLQGSHYRSEVSPSKDSQPRKQSILALSAIPKPRLTDNDSWIMKKKADAGKKDYNKHWLFQEAEQRRLEQQDRISRVRPPLTESSSLNNLSNNIQTSPSYQNHFQNVKSNFNQSTNSYSSTMSSGSHSPSSAYSPSNVSNISPSPYTSPNTPSPNLTKPPRSSLVSGSPSNYSANFAPTSSSQPFIPNGNANGPSNNWKKQTKTYQPEPPPPLTNSSKPLPDSIINTLTQRVNNKNKNTLPSSKNPVFKSNYRDENYHDYMNTEFSSSSSNISPIIPQGGIIPQQQSSPAPEDHRLLSVSGKKKCSHCSEELGRGAAMIIESLRLFYHIPCFKCCVCGIQLGNGTSGADVRVRNHKLHCHNCYSNDEGMKFSKV